MPSLFAREGLTLSNVLEQLKYRYDKEIDHCQRSSLRRIIEQVCLPHRHPIPIDIEIYFFYFLFRFYFNFNLLLLFFVYLFIFYCLLSLG